MSAALPLPAVPVSTTTYRTCPRSGLQFEAQAERLMIVNAVIAVVALLVGGVLAIGVVLTRWPAVHWLAADTCYMVLTACFVFSGTLVIARRDRTYQGSVPLVTFGAITAAIIAVFTITSGAIILIPTLLMWIGVVKSVGPLVYRTIWWAFGHSSQQI